MTQKRATSKPTNGMKPISFKLKNGLEVRLLPSRRAPVTSVQCWVKTGSADERVAEQGISHFIEHLVFKGTESFGVGEIAKVVEASGGEMNAWTSFDQTVFYINISKEFVGTALHTISDMMSTPRFDPKEIDAEREVVLEEIKRTNDNPSRRGSRLLFSNFYRRHSYRVPVIGRPEVVAKVSPKVLSRYFAERYSAKNMLLVVAGDFETPSMRRQITEHFGRVQGGRVRPVKRVRETPPTRMRLRLEESDLKETQIHICFPIPPASHKDIAGLEVLSMMLGQGDSSRLVRRLRLDEDLANSVGAGCFAPKDPGFFSISLTTRPEQTLPSIQACAEVVSQSFLQAYSSAEVERAITNIESSEYYGLESVEGLARKMGSLLTLFGDLKKFDEYMQRVREFNAQEAHRLLLKYLDPKLMTAVVLMAKGQEAQKQEVEAALRDFSGALQRARASAPARLPQKHATKKAKAHPKWKAAADLNVRIERETLPSGTRVIWRATRSAPTVSARIAWRGGSRTESIHQGGLTELLSRVWVSGTKDLDEAQLLERIENLASGLGAFGGRHTVGLSGQTLSIRQREFAPLFGEVAWSPRLSAEAVPREVSQMLEGLRTREDRPSQIASRIFMETLFRDHFYSLDPMGTPETLRGLDLKQLELHLEKNTATSPLVVVTGDLDKAVWRDAIESVAASRKRVHPGPETRRDLSGRDLFKSRTSGEQRCFRELKKEQTQIILGWPGLTLDDPRRVTLQVAQGLLSGMGGRLFVELREKKSLAYSVGPTAMEGLEGGYVGAHIGCSPEKAEESIRDLIAEFHKLAEQLVDADELARSKRFLIGHHDLGLQKASSLSSAFLFHEIYGLPAEDILNYGEQVKSVSAESLRQLIADLVSRPPTIVVVGPKSPWREGEYTAIQA